MLTVRSGVLVGPRVRIRGLSRISVSGSRLRIGLGFYGFADSRMNTLVRVRGRLEAAGGVSIGIGNRWDIGPDAVVRLGEAVHFSPQSLVIATEGITIGAGSEISWNSQLMDSDFHDIGYGAEPQPQSAPIVLGERVLVGSGASILRGTTIADGCVVAAGSVVRGVFDKPACVIAGVPARVVRENVTWDENR